jgi:succinate dehydrogenase/fumarate reductase cytochrome b subunit
MYSLNVNALLRYFIKRSTLITSRFPWGPAANRLVGQKMSCKFLIASTYDYLRKTCLWLFSTRMLYHYLSAIAHVLTITWIILSMQCPFIHPYAYSIQSYCILLIQILSLFYYCCYYFTTATTIKLLLLINHYEQVCFQVQLNWQLICQGL